MGDQIRPLLLRIIGAARVAEAQRPDSRRNRSRQQKSEEAWLVNLSSLFGLIAPPGQTAYAASKFAVRGFSEALRRELEQAKPPVGVTVVHPGGVATSISKNARLPDSLSAEEVAKRRKFFDSPPDDAAGNRRRDNRPRR